MKSAFEADFEVTCAERVWVGVGTSRWRESIANHESRDGRDRGAGSLEATKGRASERRQIV